MSNAGISISLNDDSDYGLCFACGPRNSSGLHLRFQRLGDTVSTTFLGRVEHQGFPGYVHGGIITTLLDEVMSRVSLLEGRWTMTASLDVRFRNSVRTGEMVTAVAEKRRLLRGFIEVLGRIELSDGAIAAEATGKFAYIGDKVLSDMTVGYPRLASEWMLHK